MSSVNPSSTHSSRLFSCRDMPEPKAVEVAGGTAVVFSTRCPGKVTGNEDGAAVFEFQDGSAVLAVADGLGGVAGGEQASSATLEALRRTFRATDPKRINLRSAIIDGFEQANQAVLNLGLRTATTLAVLELNHGYARPYHAGDSMILAAGGRGKIKMETMSHSPVGYAVAAGVLDAEEAMHHEDRHLVSNVVGMNDMRIDVGPGLKLAPLDTMLLASDGLVDNLHLAEIVQLIRKGKLKKVAALLVSEVEKRMVGVNVHEPSKPDDLTFIVWRRNAGHSANGKTTLNAKN
jgi:serine/threonine protein phosphatase PrpC